MNLIQRIWSYVTFAKKSDEDLNKVLDVLDKLKNKPNENLAAKTYIFRSETGIRDWERSIQNAKNPPHFNRFRLYEIVERTTYDGQVISTTTTRKAGVLAEEYLLLNQDGTINEELTKKATTPEFGRIIQSYLHSRLYGVSAVELTNEGNQLKTFVIPHYHLCPELKKFLVVPNLTTTGVDLEKLPNVLMFDQQSLGLLAAAARYALYKEFSVSDWARHSEKYGSPWLALYTDFREGDAGAQRKNMLSNFGANAWAMLDASEELEMVSDQKANAHVMYLEMIKFCDEQISKIILGQTATTDQKAYVGSAEVQERILDWHVEQDMRDFQTEANTTIINHLVKIGFLPEGTSFKWRYFYEKELQKAQADNSF